MAEKEKFDPGQYTKYEKARILGARALQISANAPILIKLSKEKLEALNYDPIKIAELEFDAAILPITVKRPLPKKIEEKVRAPEVEIVKKEEKPRKEEEKKKEEKTGQVDEEEELAEQLEEAATTEAVGVSEKERKQKGEGERKSEQQMTEEAIAEEIESAEPEDEIEE